MTDPIGFALAVAFVLAIPGPTNTLLATAAATNGLRKCLLLMPAEIAGYSISIGVLVLLVRPIAETSSTVSMALRVFCAVYLTYMAWRLWNSGAGPHSAPIRFHHVFITTLLNPKGIVFAFLIFPEVGSPLSLQFRSLALFIGICAVACAGWLTLGAIVGKQTELFITPWVFRRGAATALALFACFMLFLVASA